MTDELINTLSREYAEECIDPSGFSKDTYEELIDEKAETIAYLLRWLSDRYYLVEKSNVEDAYKSARKDIIDGYKSRIGGLIAMGRANGALLESLFPAIAKEVKI